MSAKYSRSELTAPDAEAGPLTAREREVTVLVAKGLPNREIAAALGISLHTVRTHRKSAMAKLALRNGAEIAVWAVEQGLVAPGPAHPPTSDAVWAVARHVDIIAPFSRERKPVSMALLERFRSLSFFKGRDTRGLVEEDVDFPKWVGAHRDWRGRLMSCINGGEAALDEQAARSDRECALGKWIHDHGARYYGELPAFRQLVRQHADFHFSAGDVLAIYRAHGRRAALKSLHEDFDLNSLRVIRSLEQLEAQVKGLPG